MSSIWDATGRSVRIVPRPGPCAIHTPQSDYGHLLGTLPSVRVVVRVLLIIIGLLALSVPATAVEISSDDLTDEYLISGAVILNHTFPDATDAAGCLDCHWRVIRICDSGGLDERRGCQQLPISCRTYPAEVWLAHGTAAPAIGDPAWEYRGLMCLDTPPVPVEQVSVAIPDLVRQQVPPLKPASSPRSVSLTNLSTTFSSGQPAAFTTPEVTVAGTLVQLHLTPSWTWDFGHGNPLTTTDPGRTGPASQIRHRYPRRGLYRIRVDAVWNATYAVNGIPGFVVTNPITQSAWLPLQVREARRFHIPNRSPA